MTIKILRITSVEERTGKKKSSIYAAVKNGTFPAPVSLGGRTCGWIESEVCAWIEERVQHRDMRMGAMPPDTPALD
jgi:prophage regulatory protein